jgi:hypothetical protein
MRSILISIFTLTLLSFSPLTECSRAAQSAAPSVASRPCSATPAPKKRPKPRKHALEDDVPPAGTACLEIQGDGLQLQEYLQSRIREEKWNIGEESVSEDSWSFARYLDGEQLAKFAKTDLPNQHITWTAGRAIVEIFTTPLAEGFARLQIAVRFEGYGKNADTFAPPRTSWPLASKGVLESVLMDFAKTGFRPMPSS